MLSPRLARPLLLLLLPVFSGCAESDKPASGQPQQWAGELCAIGEGQQPVAPSADGALVAYLACGSSPEIRVHDFESGEDVVLGEATRDDSVRWLQDDRFNETFVLFGTGDALSIAPSDASADALALASGVIVDHRAFKQKVNDTDFQPRLLILEEDAGTKRVSIRRPDDGYAEPQTLYEDSNLLGDLSQLSASGRTLVLTIGEAGEATGYIKQLTSGTAQTKTLPFGPKEWSMAPVGLGDQHNFALNGDELVRIELETGVLQMIVPSGSGLLEGTDHLISREEAPGKKYVYYIQNGDPTRRIREGDEEPEVLAEANAVAQAMTPDYATLLYLSDGVLYAVSALGGESRTLVEDANESGRISVVYSASTPEPFTARAAELVYQLGTALYRISLADDSVTPITGPEASAETVAYDALGEAFFYLSDSGDLYRVAPGSDEAVLAAEGVSAFWPIPESSNVLVALDGTLQVLETE